MVNTHGLKMTGLKKACRGTVNWAPRSGGYSELFYDRDSGEVWVIDQVSIGENNWTIYDNPAIIRVGTTTSHLSMQEIADMVARMVEYQNEWDMEAAYARGC